MLESGLGIGWNKYLNSVTLYVGMAPLKLSCNGPTPWQCSQGHLVRLVGRLCNLLFWGTASLSAHVLGDAAPLGGGVTFGFGAQDWCYNLGSLPYPQSTGRSMKKAVLQKMDDVMDAQVN